MYDNHLLDFRFGLYVLAVRLFYFLYGAKSSTILSDFRLVSLKSIIKYSYVVDGFVIYLFKPLLIVFSFFMFIIAYEILHAVYSLIFEIAFSTIELADSLFDEGGIDFMGTLVMGTTRGFSMIFIYVIGLMLAYQMILKGDTMILGKFKYKDDTDSGAMQQIADKAKDRATGGI